MLGFFFWPRHLRPKYYPRLLGFEEVIWQELCTHVSAPNFEDLNMADVMKPFQFGDPEMAKKCRSTLAAELRAPSSGCITIAGLVCPNDRHLCPNDRYLWPNHRYLLRNRRKL